jgi:ketosteroid isomerase-like protein
MDDTYLIDVVKTDFREAYERSDLEQLLSVFDEGGFADMSEGRPSVFGEAAREELRQRSAELFAQYSVRLSVIILRVIVIGNVAYDYGCHEFTLTPKSGEEPIRKRERYLEIWRKNSSGRWKIISIMNNSDVRQEFGGYASHWFLGEEQPRIES